MKTATRMKPFVLMRHSAEWLYYGFWYWVALYTLELPRWLIHDGAWIRQPFLWIVTQGWVFCYLPTLTERKLMEIDIENR